MRTRSFAQSALCAGIAAALAACSGGSQLSPAGAAAGSNSHWSALANAVPKDMLPRGPMLLRGRPAPDAARRGIYVSEFLGTSIFGYAKGQRPNNPPICTVPFAVSGPNNIAVDGTGNLMDPDGGTHTVIVGQGPNMCGAQAATISDPYGQPSDASSANALTGKIAVGNINGNNGANGSISICTVAAGCTQNLTNSAIGTLGGVAMDNHGNCYADAINVSRVATLTYFAGCTGSGVQATGFVNVFYGGIDIDAAGNLVTIDLLGPTGTGAVDVYSGCNPTCTLLSSTPLMENAIFGHLNHKFNNKLAVGAFTQVDVYRYSPTGGVTYAYSFNNGLAGSLSVEGVAYNRRSPQ